MKPQQKLSRIAWLLPVMGSGGLAWQHILSEFSQVFPETIVFTGQWKGYLSCFKDTFKVREVGATVFIETGQKRGSYNSGFSSASPRIFKHLLQYRPQVVITNAFSIWTLIAITLKPLGKWKLIIAYEGGSPGVDYKKSSLRAYSRKLMVRLSDAFVSNSQAGKHYLIEDLGAKANTVFTRPFLIPSVGALLEFPEAAKKHITPQLSRPTFLYVGQMVPRKGARTLIEACIKLKDQGYRDYTLIMIGEGTQRPALEKIAKDTDLTDQIIWLGNLPYGSLGSYFQSSDVFIFPTNEDIWGMVLPEAMAFGKPVICSKGAGSAEMIVHGDNGFIFPIGSAVDISQHMRQFIAQPELISTMGARSKRLMIEHTPKEATQCFIKAARFVSLS